MLNKKAQVPTLIIFIVALVLAITTLFAMVSFNNNLTSQSKQLSEMMEEIIFNEKYIIEQAKLIAQGTLLNCPTCEAEQIKKKYKEDAGEREQLFRYGGAGNFYAKIRNDEFEIEKQDNLFILKIEDLFVESQIEANNLKRTFNLELTIK
jgi:Tfp pilus assembly protein PilE